jgi:hypothetical protein
MRCRRLVAEETTDVRFPVTGADVAWDARCGPGEDTMVGRPARAARSGAPDGARRSRWQRLALLGPLLLVAVTLSWLSPAAATAAVTIDCTPMGDPACRSLTPVLECVWDNKNGTSTVVWGYDNPSTSVLNIDVGNKNNMSPGAENQGQPTTFLPGRRLNVFTTVISGTATEWRLGNNKAALDKDTRTCASHQVPVFGDLTALGIGIAAMLALGLPVLAARPRPLPVTR